MSDGAKAQRRKDPKAKRQKGKKAKRLRGLADRLAMVLAASVSGFYIGCPDSVYFNVGKTAQDQLQDMVERRGMDEAVLTRPLAPVL